MIEVAISSYEVDQQKRKIYAVADVLKYWILLPETRSLEVYTGPSGNDYVTRKIYAGDELITSEAFPPFQIKLADLFGAGDSISNS